MLPPEANQYEHRVVRLRQRGILHQVRQDTTGKEAAFADFR